MENNFSIIISTCDKFSDLWDAHILLLNRIGQTKCGDVFG